MPGTTQAGNDQLAAPLSASPVRPTCCGFRRGVSPLGSNQLAHRIQNCWGTQTHCAHARAFDSVPCVCNYNRNICIRTRTRIAHTHTHAADSRRTGCTGKRLNVFAGAPSSERRHKQNVDDDDDCSFMRWANRAQRMHFSRVTRCGLIHCRPRLSHMPLRDREREII